MNERELYWIAALGFAVALFGAGVMAHQQAVMNAVVHLLGFLIAAFSFGRLTGGRHARRRQEPIFTGAVDKEDSVIGSWDGITMEATMTADAMQNLSRVMGFDKEDEMNLATDISMCAECSALLDDSRDQRNHQGRLVERCLTCAKHGLCPLDVSGVHVFCWPEDPEFDPTEVDIGPLPDDVRAGYCKRCLQGFWESDKDSMVRDLTWQAVGVMWAERTNPELLKHRAVTAEFVHYWHSAHSSHLNFRFKTDTGEEYQVRQSEPLLDLQGTLVRAMRAMGADVSVGSQINLDDLMGRKIRLEVEGSKIKDVLPPEDSA